MEGAILVAKKKAAKPSRTDSITIRCTPGFKVWLDGFADNQRLTPTLLIEQGLVDLAKTREYKAPPKR